MIFATNISLVSPPGRDSRDSRSSRLAEATQKALGTNALLNCFRYIYLFPSPDLSNIYKIVFLIISSYYNTRSILADN